MKSLLIVTLLGLGVHAAIAQEARDKLADLEGGWNISSIVVSGQPFPGMNGPTKLLIKGGKATLFAEGKEISSFRELAIRPHAAKDSLAIDIFRDATSFLPCLYELNRDGFKLAMPLIPENAAPDLVLPRPESFDSKGKPIIGFTMTKAKD